MLLSQEACLGEGEGSLTGCGEGAAGRGLHLPVLTDARRRCKMAKW